MVDDAELAVRAAEGRTALGLRLRGLRQAAGLTVAGAATGARLSQGYLSEVERGRKLPALDSLDRLCGVLGVSVVEALAGVYPFGSSVRPEGLAPPPDGRAEGRVSS